RSQGGRNPYDRGLQDLIGELSTRSDEFRVRWATHNVRFHRTGTKRLQHPVVGELDLSYETLTLDADDGLRMALYTAEADSAPPPSTATGARSARASAARASTATRSSSPPSCGSATTATTPRTSASTPACAGSASTTSTSTCCTSRCRPTSSRPSAPTRPPR